METKLVDDFKKSVLCRIMSEYIVSKEDLDTARISKLYYSVLCTRNCGILEYSVFIASFMQAGHAR